MDCMLYPHVVPAYKLDPSRNLELVTPDFSPRDFHFSKAKGRTYGLTLKCRSIAVEDVEITQ